MNAGVFTNALIGELRQRATDDPNFDKCFSVAQLHQGLLSRMLRYPLQRLINPGIFGAPNRHCSTPEYISLNKDYNQASIPLKRFCIAEVWSQASRHDSEDPPQENNKEDDDKDDDLILFLLSDKD